MAQFTKYTGNVTGQVGSLITALDAALVTGEGWTAPYSGTNKKVYQAPSGNQLYLRVDDNGPGAGGAKEARITGYETMSDVDTGTNPFPTAAQGVGGVAMLPVRKSTTADATNRSYKIFADARTAYVFIATGDSASVHLGWMFGEIYSLVSSDSWNTLLVGRIAENNGTLTNDRLDAVHGATMTQALSGHYMARPYNGLPTSNGSVLVGKHGDFTKSGNSAHLAGATSGAVFYPNSADGGLYLSPVWINETGSTTLRGRLRGLWQVCHAVAGFNDGDTFSGVGDLAGKTFEIVKATGNTSLYCIETSNTLETN